MATYERVPARTDQRRPYTVTVGLVPGYGVARAVDDDRPGHPRPYDTLTRRAVLAAHGLWMIERIAAGKPYLTGSFRDTVISYAWPRPETGQPPAYQLEDGLEFVGEVSVLYAAAVTDEEVTDMLDELAARLAGSALQERVYVAYRDRCWVSERHGHAAQADEQLPAGDR